jgi:hypothetical protein
MAKRTNSSDPPTKPGAAPASGGQKRRKRLERELAELEASQAKRLERIDRLRVRATEVRTTLATLVAKESGASTRPDPEPSATGPTGYCLHERRRVTISAPTSRTLSNGRTGLVGACSSCGRRVTVLAARQRPISG